VVVLPTLHKKMKKQTRKQEPKNQVRAFRKAARQLGADESEERFDAALKKVARHKPAKGNGDKESPQSRLASKR
jgi:hypothetical protein